MLHASIRKPPSTNAKIVTEQLGIWRVRWSKPDLFDFGTHWKEMASVFPWFYRMAVEVYRLSPSLFVFYIISVVWQGLQPAIYTHLSSHILRMIEIGIIHDSKSGDILSALMYRLVFVASAAVANWWSASLDSIMKGRVTCHLEMILMQTKLQLDLPTSKDTANTMRTTAEEAWQAFSEISKCLTETIAFASQLALITHLSRSSGGPVFLVFCITKPLIATFYQRSLWDKACIGYITDPYYTRMKALKNLATEDDYKQDVRAGNLAMYILSEYRKAYNKLGALLTEHPYTVYDRFPSPWFDVIKDLSGDLPTAYCAVNAIINPTMLSLSSIAILEQSSSRLRYSLEILFRDHESFKRNINILREVYAPANVGNMIKDGVMPYPLKGLSEKGMSFELRNITFQYPGSTKASKALENLSISIQAGQFVAIVGSNGSGKSTLIKLLSRLYNPDSGSLLIDGYPASSYKMADLHEATAVLSQDNNMFPISLGENIGIGYPEFANNQDMIIESARKGGALEFISKYSDGFSTFLDPMVEPFSINVRGNREHPLHEELEELDKKTEISGGERQRVAASRTFMRFASGRVKFVAVDEPSSALDAEGELQLFQNLVEAREGKTMIFVTHRFGHLTRYADKIICMKNGNVAESGTHGELMELNGEYAKLYDIQAKSFLTETLETACVVNLKSIITTD